MRICAWKNGSRWRQTSGGSNAESRSRSARASTMPSATRSAVEPGDGSPNAGHACSGGSSPAKPEAVTDPMTSAASEGKTREQRDRSTREPPSRADSIPSRRGGPRIVRRSVGIPLALGIRPAILLLLLAVGWQILVLDDPRPITQGLSTRDWLMLILGTVFFALVLAGLVALSTWLVREMRLNQRQRAFLDAVTHEMRT